MLALKTHEKIAITMAAIAAIVGVWLLRSYDPNTPNSLFPPCMFRAFTGFHCIGCGLTRALHALVHGDLARAFAMNPLAILALPLLPLMLLHDRSVMPAPLKPFMSAVMTPKLWLILLPAYWIARNLPWVPFTWLAPG
jgi:hypothetical protein